MSILGQLEKNNNLVITALIWGLPAAILGYLILMLQLPLIVHFVGFNICAFGAITISWILRGLKGKGKLKKLFLIASAIFLVTLLITPPARAASIKEFTLPAGGSMPYNIIVDDQDPYRVWWTEYGSDRIGNLKSDTGEITEYNLGTAARPWDIAINYAKDFIYWTENSANMIGRMKQDGSGDGKKRYPLGTEYGSGPKGISAENRTDRDIIWFTLYAESRICRMNLTDDNVDHPIIDYWQVPGPTSSGPHKILYSDIWGGVWFTEYTSNQIGFLNPTVNLFKEWTLPTTDSKPFDIDIDSYGYIWFSMSGTNKIGKLNPYTNVITEYVMPDSNSRPYGIVIDSADAAWIADNGANKIVRFTADLVFTEFAKSGGSSPWGITAKSGSPDTIWATDGSTRILKLDPTIGVTTTTVPTTSAVSTVITTTTGSTTTLSTTSTGRYFFSTTNVATGTAAVSTTTMASSTEYTVSETVRHVFTRTTATSTTYISTTTGTLTTNTTLTKTSTSYISTTVATLTTTTVVNGTTTTYVTTVTTTGAPPGNVTCIIATAAYGSELSPEVSFLRAFRDQAVMSTFAGKQFMSVFNAWYYSFSPHVAKTIADNAFVRSIMKAVLYPLIGTLKMAEYTSSILLNLNPELAMVAAGLVASSLIGVVYFAPIALLFQFRIRRYYRLKGNSNPLLALAGLWLASALVLTIGEFLMAPILVMFSTAMLVLVTLMLSGIAFASFVLQKSIKF